MPNTYPAAMAWITTTTNVLYNVLYYLSFPVITIFGWLLLPLTPLFHLLSYTFHALYLPIHYLAKFESLYIYFSVAVLIGLLSGGILHLLSTFIYSLIDLQTTPSLLQSKQTPKISHHQKRKQQEQIDESHAARLKNLPPKRQEISKAYSEYWNQPRTASVKRRGGKGNLVTQTILEEEDSDDMF